MATQNPPRRHPAYHPQDLLVLDLLSELVARLDYHLDLVESHRVGLERSLTTPSSPIAGSERESRESSVTRLVEIRSRIDRVLDAIETDRREA